MTQRYRQTLAGDVQRAAAVVSPHFDRAPDAAIILGTGLGALAHDIDVDARVPYADVAGVVPATVESHAGAFVCGRIGGKTVIAMSGRLHRYEGYSLQQVTFPVRVLRALGVRTLLVSNASGCVNPQWRIGDLMLLADHINLLGDNPLIGPNDDTLGPRFPDMSEPYDEALRVLARAVAFEHGIELREGVYAAVTGPTLETRAEYRMLRTLGADVVGMSTVPEVIVAIHSGMRVLGVSVITDMGTPDQVKPVTLEDVVAVANEAQPRLTTLMRGVVERL
jgi:purine-nucleoside phosphorylase